MATALESLDRLLIESDTDSMDWCDGLGHEMAGELLAKLQEVEWDELISLCELRSLNWRECLASAICPQQGEAAKRLLFSLASDREGDVSFYALSQVAFYCGVNANAEGVFMDNRIEVSSFVVSARLASELPAAIQRVSARCSEHFRHRLDLLTKVIQS